MSNIEASDDAQRIEVNGQVIDPSEHYARDAQNTDHIIVTVKDVLDDDQKAALQKEKVDLLEDLGYNNMLCRYRPTNLEPLRNLDFVKQVDVYRNLFKIPDELTVLIEELQGKADFESEAFPIDVMVHEDVKNLDPLADDISKISEVDRNQMDVMPDRIRLRVPLSKLKAIAADDRVRILEEALTPVLYDDEAKHIVGAPLRIQGDTEFRGAGQIVAVVDGGFDLGSVEDCHPALTNRIRGLISVGRAKDTGTTEAQKVDDWVGHGTHVCGTIVGKEIETSRGMVGGVAQDADLVVSSLQNAKGKVIDVMPSMQVLFEVPYKLHHACIHSNSWGDNLSGGMMQRAYTTDASTIDDFVRTNPDVLICFSAGNYNENVKDRPPKGEEKPAIGSQASAKNCLTVGASGSTRAVVDTKTSHVDKVDPNLMSPISSRGPVKGFRGDPPTVKRMKPDVVAPGHNVVSAHTRHPKAPIDGLPEATSSSFPDVLWKVRTGTSHSTPLVSGCAAILRQVLQSKGCQNPPAALLKAIIINGADKLPDIDVEAQGFGRVNLQSSVNMLQTPPILAENILKSAISSSGGSVIGNSLRQNDSFAFELSPVKAADELELKITMVYNDKGGGQIQNNLNLAVVDKVTGEIRHGGLSEDDIDVQNNVEQVVCQPAPTTPVIVRVTAQKIFKDLDQDFVLAWSTTAPFQIEGQGHDDAFALLLAAYHPSLDLLGVSTVHGNASLEQTTSNALRILTAIGRPDIPVHPGAAKPFCRAAVHAPGIHGSSGIDGTDLLPEAHVPAIRKPNAVLAMRHAIMDQPADTVSLVATGALTNVALLFATFPETVSHVKGLSIMGGGIGDGFTDAQGLRKGGGNETDWAEFNIYCDPEAAGSILPDELVAKKTTLIPLDLTHQAIATDSIREKLLHGRQSGPPSTLRTLFHDLLTYFARTYSNVFGLKAGPPLHDPLAVAVLLSEEELTINDGEGERWHVEVVTDGVHSARSEEHGQLGRTIASSVSERGTGGIRIPRSFDKARFWDLIDDALTAAEDRLLAQ